MFTNKNASCDTSYIVLFSEAWTWFCLSVLVNLKAMLSRRLCINKNDIPAVWSLTRHIVTMPMTSKQTNLAYNFVADQVWDLFVGILRTSSCLLAGWHSVELTNRDSFQASSKIEQNQAYRTYLLPFPCYVSISTHAHRITAHIVHMALQRIFHPLNDCLENENAIHHVFTAQN